MLYLFIHNKDIANNFSAPKLLCWFDHHPLPIYLYVDSQSPNLNVLTFLSEK